MCVYIYNLVLKKLLLHYTIICNYVTVALAIAEAGVGARVVMVAVVMIVIYYSRYIILL